MLFWLVFSLFVCPAVPYCALSSMDFITSNVGMGQLVTNLDAMNHHVTFHCRIVQFYTPDVPIIFVDLAKTGLHDDHLPNIGAPQALR